MPCWTDRGRVILIRCRCPFAAQTDNRSIGPVVLENKVKSAVSATGGGRRPLAVLLSGQGAQHPGMMKELYDDYPEIKAVLDRGEALFQAARSMEISS